MLRHMALEGFWIPRLMFVDRGASRAVWGFRFLGNLRVFVEGGGGGGVVAKGPGSGRPAPLEHPPPASEIESLGLGFGV